MSLNSDSNSERWHLGRRLALLVLLIIALALGLAILLRQKSDFPLPMFNILAIATTGVVAGLAARIVLNQRNWFIRGIASAALVVIGLLILGFLTDERGGITLPPFGWVSVNWLGPWDVPLKLPLQVMSSQMNWPVLVELLIAIDISWITLRAWSRSTSQMVGTAAPSVQKRRSKSSSRAPGLPHLTFPKIRTRTSNAKPKVRRRETVQPLITKSTAPDPIRPVRSKNWNPLHRKPQIQLAVYEEHRCPYCLEEVKRNDARGVVECEVCHTLHHKDCWAITGACQVPHLNT